MRMHLRMKKEATSRAKIGLLALAVANKGMTPQERGPGHVANAERLLWAGHRRRAAWA
jgi:hypothetical protein